MLVFHLHSLVLLADILMLNYLFEWESLNPFHGVHIKDVNCIFTIHGEIGCIVTWEKKEVTAGWLLSTIKPKTF